MEIQSYTLPSMLSRAIRIAACAHDGQVDKAGYPYILHCLAVMNSIRSIAIQIPAVLHDVVEDTNITLADLSKEFPNSILDTLSLLTHAHDQSEDEYFRYIAMIKQYHDPSAQIIKIADLRHNLIRERIPYATMEDERRWRKYRTALEILENGFMYFEALTN